MGEAPTDVAPFAEAFHRRARWVLWAGLALVLTHAFVPQLEFVHRADDAFYFFKVAENFAEYGFWTFDGVHRTNGVQPLWAFILTATAKLLSLVGVTDPGLLARIFVGMAGVVHFAGCMLLYSILRRYVSTGTAVAATGGFLFSMGIVWARVWGMENSLYALLLLSTVLYHQRVFRERESLRSAAVLGLLLGATTLSRLNAGLFTLCMLAYYCFWQSRKPVAHRLRVSVAIGLAAAAIVLPVLLYNLAHTGHLLPVGGGAKAIRARQFLESEGVTSVFSTAFLSVMLDWAWPALRWWISSRSVDGMWIVGVRIPVIGALPLRVMTSLIAALLLLPLLTRHRDAWFDLLRERFGRLRPFAYLPAFAALNVLLSVLLFPYDATYSVVRWWLVEGEIVMTVLAATLSAAFLRFMADEFLPRRIHLRLATIGLVALVAVHAQRSIRFYWDGEAQYPDWNVSTNGERYAAALWIRDNLPPDAVIGSWNAGVLGYYSERCVVNLDGLINGWDFLPYLEAGAIADYIRDEGIEYIADTNFEIRHRAGSVLRGEFEMTPVYREHMDPTGTGLPYKDQFFYVYRIEGPAPRSPSIHGE